MKNLIVLIFSILLVFSSCDQTKRNQELPETLISENTAAEQPEKLLRHVVLFKFKDSATEEDISQIVEAFRELPQKIDGIVDFEWGTDISPEGLSDGFTHSFLVSFKDEKSRDEYLPHPAHKAFGAIVGPHLEKVLVIDYWPKE